MKTRMQNVKFERFLNLVWLTSNRDEEEQVGCWMKEKGGDIESKEEGKKYRKGLAKPHGVKIARKQFSYIFIFK